jgi:hypothetical protein
LRPFTFSFSNVLAIKEVQLLLATNFFHQMSGTILYSLEVKGTIPLTQTSYNFYLAGAATSLVAIASISDFIFKKKKKFFPLMIWLFISMIYQFSCLMVSLFK